MDKILAYIAAVEGIAKAIAGSAAFPESVTEAAQRVVDAGEAVKAELSHPDAGRIFDYIKHHGNLPGTPESRGEAQG